MAQKPQSYGLLEASLAPGLVGSEICPSASPDVEACGCGGQGWGRNWTPPVRLHSETSNAG